MTTAAGEAGEAEVERLLEGVFRKWGWDFRGYARASIGRRLRSRLAPEGVETLTGLLEKVLDDPEAMERLLLALTIHVTELFRDPGFYLAFRRKVVPWLKTYPFVRIWHAGCSSGEEVYSMAILLEEEGLGDRCRLYATDLSEAVLRTAREGVYPLSSMRAFTANYLEAGGTKDFSSYYTARYEGALLRPSLRDRMVFAAHNLVTDASFNEFHAVLCRNVMIYFGPALSHRVHRLLYGSLVRLGVLGLGRRESLRFSPFESHYETLDAAERLYRRIA